MKIPHGALILAADGRKVLLFRNEGARDPRLETVAHDESAGPASHEIGSDRPGRSFSSTGSRRSAYEDTDWHQQDEQHFARHVAGMLEAAASDDDGAGIVIVAPPQFLGLLREHLGPAIKQRLLAEIAKDLVHRSTEDIAETVAESLEDVPSP